MNATKSAYEIEADELLKEMAVEFKAEFLEHGKHFPDDKESRDIYELSLKRNGLKIHFRFGQSISRSKPSEAECNREWNKHHEWMKCNNAVKKLKKRALAPTAYDLLACLQKNSPGSFDDFCVDFGYNNDSRRAENTWRSVVEEWFKVESFFTPEEIMRLQEIS